VLPSSHWSKLTPVMELVVGSGATSVLDVGTGSGKFGVLCREYLEVYPARDSVIQARDRAQAELAGAKIRLEGIEGCAEYISALHDLVYDRLYIGDAVTVLRSLAEGAYDLVLLIDVLEHLPKDHGFSLLQQCRRVGRTVIVATPRGFTSQSALFGNDLECHRCQWSRRELRRAGARLVFRAGESYVAVLGKIPSTKYAPWSRKLKRLIRQNMGLGKLRHSVQQAASEQP